MRPLVWAVVLLGLTWAQNGVPWPAGEKAVYNLNWLGVPGGQLYLEAQPQGQGWHFRGEFVPQGLAKLLGYALSEESWTDAGLHTLRFHKVLTEPVGRQTVLQSTGGPGGIETNTVFPDGRRVSWRSTSTSIVDDLGVVFLLRWRPDTRQIKVIDTPRLVEGRIEVLGKNAQGWLGYRLEQDNLLLEAWYRQDARRTLMRLVMGRDWGRLEANLDETAP